MNGLEAKNNGAIIVTRSTISGNGTGWVTTAGGAVESYVDNNFGFNDSLTASPTPFGGGYQ